MHGATASGRATGVRRATAACSGLSAIHTSLTANEKLARQTRQESASVPSAAARQGCGLSAAVSVV